MLLDSINYLAVLAAGIAAFAIGAVWYSALFSKAWIAAVGKPPEEFGKPAPAMISTFICYLLMAFMSAVVQVWVGVASPAQGAAVGAMMWLGFSVTSISPGIMFSGASRRLLWIDGGCMLTILIAVGAILGAWRIEPPPI